jgi:hypothetical protein
MQTDTPVSLLFYLWHLLVIKGVAFQLQRFELLGRRKLLHQQQQQQEQAS